MRFLAFLAALFLALPAYAGCRDITGAYYTFPHIGKKASGEVTSSLVMIWFYPTGSARIQGWGNHDQGIVPEEGLADWHWHDACFLVLGANFMGHVTADARFISLVTFDDERYAGIAVRDNP